MAEQVTRKLLRFANRRTELPQPENTYGHTCYVLEISFRSLFADFFSWVGIVIVREKDCKKRIPTSFRTNTLLCREAGPAIPVLLYGFMLFSLGTDIK